MDTLRFVNAADLDTELARWHHLGECLLLELSLIRFGFGVRLVFDHIWAPKAVSAMTSASVRRGWSSS